MEKKEVLLETLKFLNEEPVTSEFAIFEYFKDLLTRRGEIGQKVQYSGLSISTSYTSMSESDQRLINNVIWDLILERVITPGKDYGIYELPHLYVSDAEKLNQKLVSLT